MTEVNKPLLVELLYQLADDELVIGHRDSEWLGLAPHLEEDVAFSSIAQDEVGHANGFYQLLEQLGEGKADDLAFLRPAAVRRNAVLLERPNGDGTYMVNPQYDWGYTIARHLAYDLFDNFRLEVLARSSYEPLAKLAVKIKREERYHLLHHATWLKRLAGGTQESRRKLAEGIAKVWPDLGGLFAMGEVAGTDLFPATTEEMIDRFKAAFADLCNEAGIVYPADIISPPPVNLDGRVGVHTADLEALLATMSEVYATAPGASW